MGIPFHQDMWSTFLANNTKHSIYLPHKKRVVITCDIWLDSDSQIEFGIWKKDGGTKAVILKILTYLPLLPYFYFSIKLARLRHQGYTYLYYFLHIHTAPHLRLIWTTRTNLNRGRIYRWKFCPRTLDKLVPFSDWPGPTCNFLWSLLDLSLIFLGLTWTNSDQ